MTNKKPKNKIQEMLDSLNTENDFNQWLEENNFNTRVNASQARMSEGNSDYNQGFVDGMVEGRIQGENNANYVIAYLLRNLNSINEEL